MFQREKFAKSNQFFNNQNTSKNNISSSKYFHKPFYKNQKQNSKRYKCNQLWKKNSSFHWSEKENDKNNSNYQHNKKFHFEGKKTFHYYKKITKTKFDYNFTYTEEEAKNQIIDDEQKINEDCGLSKENSKDEKNNSMEYNTNTTTTAYSHSKSTSAHDELSIINGGNGNNSDNLNLNNYNYSSTDLILKKYSSAEIKQINNPFQSDLSKDLSNQFFSNLMKINMNLIKFNSNKDIIEYTPSQIQKGQNNKRKHSDGNSNKSFEPYNKYNSVSQEMNKSLVNPMTENTEILNVSIKISKNKRAMFKLRRFDDLFMTVKLFCEINQIEEKLMKPIIIKTLCSLNSIYQIFNCQLDGKNIQRLSRINSFINNTFI